MFFGRGKNKIQNCYLLEDFYKDYLQTIDNEKYSLSYKEYKTILAEYFKGIVDVLYNDCVKFKLPNHLGTFQIVKKKGNAKKTLNNPRSIDWENTHKYGKRVFYVNEHSDGYRYFFTWYKNASLKNITKYRFVPTRTNKRKLAYYIKNRIKDYFEIIDKRK
jgi:hypothetical protein